MATDDAGAPALGPSPRTYGICSELADEAGRTALGLWDHLEARYGLRQVRAAARPHVSYLVGESDRASDLAAALADVAPGLSSFIVTLSGVRAFDGPEPVVYLAVDAGPALTAAHRALLRATQPLWSRIWPHYLPGAWTPHVTLALRDLPRERLGEVLADLRDRTAPHSARLAHLDLVHVILPTHVRRARAPMGEPVARGGPGAAG